MNNITTTNNTLSVDRIEKAENAKDSKVFSKVFFINQLILAIAVQDVFLGFMVFQGFEFWGAHWMIYCLFQLLIPIQALVAVLWSGDSDWNKLCARFWLSSMAIWALVNIIVGIFFILDWRRPSILATGCIGLVSSLYYWFLIEKQCFKASENKDNDDIKALSAKAVDEPLDGV